MTPLDARISGTISWWTRQAIGGFWDLVYDVDTRGGVIADESLAITSSNRDKGVVYDPTPWSVVKAVARLLPESPEEFCFVDMGSGKGRVVLAAQALPYRAVLGVEYSPFLCRIAEANLQSQRLLPRRARTVSIVSGDAVDFPIPDGPCIFFFYNPFAPALLETVIENVVASFRRAPRNLYLVFFASSKAIAGIGSNPSLKLMREATVRCDLIYFRRVSIFRVAAPAPA